MASITVHVRSQDLENGAKQFDQSRRNCENLVKKMMNTCTGLQNKWKSPAATKYYQKLQALSNDLEDIRRIINEHVNDLREIKKIYEKMDSDAVNVANSLTPDVLSY